MSARLPFPVHVLLLSIALLLIGPACGPRMSERTHARYLVGAPFKYRPADPGGVYQVKWAPAEEGPWTVMPGTARTVAQGELLGFVLGENGTLTAVAGEQRFSIVPLPADAKIFVWSTEFERKPDAPSDQPSEPETRPDGAD